jgi:hypothetical protein
MPKPRKPTKRESTNRTRITRSEGGPLIQEASLPKAKPSSHDELVALKRSLEAISLSLNRIDPDSLSEEDRVKWARRSIALTSQLHAYELVS